MDAPIGLKRTFSGNKIKIIFANGKSYDVEKEVAMMFVTVQNMLSFENAESVILPKDDIREEVFNKVLDYCRYHYIHDEPPQEEPEWAKYMSEYPKKKNINPLETIEKWDTNFFVGDTFTNPPTLEKLHDIFHFVFDINIAADYLDVRQLNETCSKILAKILTGKNPEEMRIVTGFKNDFSPEEDAENMKIYKHFDV